MNHFIEVVISVWPWWSMVFLLILGGSLYEDRYVWKEKDESGVLYGMMIAFLFILSVAWFGGTLVYFS